MPIVKRLVRTWILLALLLAGCTRGLGTRLPTYPVSGTVSAGGKPAAGAIVQLSAIGDPRLDGLFPHAIVDKTGAYRLTTYRTEDGAPAGTYAVTLRWPAPPAPGQDKGPDRYAGRYADVERPIRRVEIKAGNNTLEPIELKEEQPPAPRNSP
jgi:hypothetical protein